MKEKKRSLRLGQAGSQDTAERRRRGRKKGKTQKHLLSTSCIPGTADIAVSKGRSSHETYTLVGRWRQTLTNPPDL